VIPQAPLASRPPVGEPAVAAAPAAAPPKPAPPAEKSAEPAAKPAPPAAPKAAVKVAAAPVKPAASAAPVAAKPAAPAAPVAAKPVAPAALVATASKPAAAAPPAALPASLAPSKQLTQAQIRQIMLAAESQWKPCLKDAFGSNMSIGVLVAGSGQVQKADILGPLAQSATGRCITEQIRKLRFPAFTEGGPTKQFFWSYQIPKP
jgi:hypothetical protein